MKTRALNNYYAKHYSPTTPFQTPGGPLYSDERTPFVNAQRREARRDDHPGVLKYDVKKEKQAGGKGLRVNNAYYVAGGIVVAILIFFFLVNNSFEKCSFSQELKDEQDQVRTLKRLIKLMNSSYMENYHELKTRLAIKDTKLLTFKSDLRASARRESNLRKRLGREENMIDTFEAAVKKTRMTNGTSATDRDKGIDLKHAFPNIRIRHNIMDAVNEALAS